MTLEREARRVARSILPKRDMDASAFHPILEELVARLPGAYAAVLVDRDGESVDYAGRVDPFDVRVSAAHWKIVLDGVSRGAVLGVAHELIVRTSTRSFVLRRLPDGYAVMILLRRRAGFSVSPRAFAACERALRREAGWPKLSMGRGWYPAAVSCDDRGRPSSIRVASDEIAVEILGTIVGLSRTERGYRARLPSGAEFSLVREPGANWYIDEQLASTAERGA